MDLAQTLSIWIPLAATILGSACAVHALLTKTRTSTSALAWMLSCLGIPVIGSLLYLTVGQSRITKKRLIRRREAVATFEQRARRSRENHLLERPLGPVGASIQALVDAAPIAGNAIAWHVGGEAAFPKVLAAIAHAKRGICVQFYILDGDASGCALRDALAERVKAGVPVRLIYDAVGCSSTPTSFWNSCRSLGIRVYAFLPISPLRGRFEVNLRNHRKLVIVDGEVAFTGSMNWSNRHLLEEAGTSRDIMFEIRGPVVTEQLRILAEDWFFVTDEDLRQDPIFKTPDACGDLACHVLESGPDQERFVFHEALLLAIHRSEHRLHLVTPYFVPDPSVSDALCLAARRGVDVRLVVPQNPDMRVLRFATDDHIKPLLAAGVRIYRKPGPMLHMKLAVIDDELVLAGSSNLDQRSFFLNFEADLAVHGRAFADGIATLCREEWASSHEVSPFAELQQRWYRYLMVRLASLFSPIL